MKINREKYYNWAWLIDLFIKEDGKIGGFSSAREHLYATAYSFLGKDASPTDQAPDELACAESVNAIFLTAFGEELGGDVSTLRMYQVLQKSKGFQEVDAPLFGDVIISPTTYTRTAHGHVGIVGKWQIMSNNSNNGRWEAHYTLESWRLKYGFVKYFRCVLTDTLPENPPPAAPPGVKEIVEETVKVANEAAKYPVLLAPVMALLSALGKYLAGLKIKS